MFCPKCGSENPEQARFCYKCGYDLSTLSQFPTKIPTNQNQSNTGIQITPTRKSHVLKNLVIALVVIFAILAISEMWLSSIRGPTGSAGIIPTQKSISILSGSIKVNPLSQSSYSFSVPNAVLNPVISGSFSVSGGSGNDINVYIMSSQDYSSWKNGNQVYPNYNSGRVSSGNINLQLSPGQAYYIIFDNTFSLISSKTVSGQITLTYIS